MALEMKETSKWWYGRIKVNGKLKRFPLMETRNGRQQRIEIKGRRPKNPSRWKEGDAAFIESYHRAKAAHEVLLGQVLTPVHIVEHEQRIIEAKRGARLEFVKIEDVPDAWEQIPRKKDPSAKYVSNSKKKLQGFVDFLRRNHPDVEELIAVRASHVQAFLTEEADRGISARTWNVTLKLLKTVFSRFAPDADAYRDCLRKMPQREEDTVHREPFTEEEIEAILEAAHDDDLMRPLIVIAVCTAMRFADCALLEWKSVHLEEEYIKVRTSKTGQTVEIPILPLLRGELERMPRKKSGYVFPEAAERFSTKPWELNRRFQRILGRAGFVDAPEQEDDAGAGDAAVAEQSPGQPASAEAPEVIRGTIRAEKNGSRRRRRGSLRGWHSFRTTYVTRNLTRGIPEELVREVTGHTAVEVVRKHYLKAGREDFRREFEKAMPRVTQKGAKSRDERLREIIEKMGPEELREEALGLLREG